MIGHGLNNNNIYDLSVYDKNKVLFTPLSTLKNDGNKHPLFSIAVPLIFEENMKIGTLNFKSMDQKKKNQF